MQTLRNNNQERRRLGPTPKEPSRLVYWKEYNKGRTVRLVAKEVKLSLVIISVTFTLICVMIIVGGINFFEGMSCEQLEKYVSDIPRGKYPFGTPFTPSQIDYLDQQYADRCGSQPQKDLVHNLLADEDTDSYHSLFHDGISYYELNREINNIST